MGRLLDGGRGYQPWLEDEAQGLLSQVFPFVWYCLIFDCSLAVLWLSLTFVTDPSLLFQGLHLLLQANLLLEEVQHLEMEGLQKVELAVAGSEAGDLYRLLRGALSHSPMSIA